MTFIVLFFAIMIAFAVGAGMPNLVKHALNPAPREPHLIATIWVGTAGVVYLVLSKDQKMTEVLTGIAFASLLARFLVEDGLQHARCSRAVDAILALSTYEERITFLRSLPHDIQQMVRKRTPRSDLQNPEFNLSEPVLMANCANPAGRTV